MESDKRKIHSPRNYRNNNSKPQEEPPQQVQFSIFKRKTTENCSLGQQGCLTVGRNDHNMLSILGGLHLMYLKNYSQPHLFKEIELANIDRTFLQYMHQKTLQQFLKIFKEKFTSLTALADILNQYPVASVFLDIYVRQFASSYLQNLTQTEEELMMGNEFQFINDCSCEPRGNSLDILCKSLKINMSIKHYRSQPQKFVRKYSLTQLDEQYGSNDPFLSLELTFGSKEVIYKVIQVKQLSSMKKSKVQLLQRRSRIPDIESGRTSTESRSITKEKGCEECGKKRCKCAQLQVSLYSSNNINLSRSISGDLAQGGKGGLHRFNSLGMGFINVNKIVNRDRKS